MPPSAPPPDLDRLAEALLELAVELLRRKGRFFPFGAVVWAADGELQLAAADPEAASSRDPAGLLEALVADLREEASGGRIRAAGTCVDVRDDPELGQAIRCDVEQVGGEARALLVPYERRFPRRFLLAPQPVRRPGVPRLQA